jgi:hypothetical protein
LLGLIRVKVIVPVGVFPPERVAESFRVGLPVASRVTEDGLATVVSDGVAWQFT